LIAWLLLRRVVSAHVVSAIVCGTLASGILGTYVPGRLGDRSPRKIVAVGASVGLLFHPLTWFMYTFGAWTYAWIDGRAPLGHIWESLANALLWSIPSVTYGGAITLPIFLLVTWLYTRWTTGPPASEVQLEDAQPPSATDNNPP